MKLLTSRLLLSIAALAILGALTVFALRYRDEPDEASLIERRSPTAALDTALVDRIEIERPGAPKLTLERSGESFRMVEPLEASLEPNAAETLLRRLASLEIDSVAATKERFHDRLEIEEGRAIELRLYSEGSLLHDLRIGAYRSQTTMLREAGSEIVLAARANLRALAEREIDELRDKAIFNLDSAKIRALEFSADGRSLRFIRGDAEDDFAPDEGVTIEKYNPATLRSRALTLARLRASAFASDDVDEEALGLDPPRARVGIELEGGERYELDIGGEEGRGVYVKRAGIPTIYILPKATAERMMPKRADLEGESAAAQEPSFAPTRHNMGDDDMAGSMDDALNAVPPDVLEAIQRGLQ